MRQELEAKRLDGRTDERTDPVERRTQISWSAVRVRPPLILLALAAASAAAIHGRPLRSPLHRRRRRRRPAGLTFAVGSFPPRPLRRKYVTSDDGDAKSTTTEERLWSGDSIISETAEKAQREG